MISGEEARKTTEGNILGSNVKILRRADDCRTSSLSDSKQSTVVYTPRERRCTGSCAIEAACQLLSLIISNLQRLEPPVFYPAAIQLIIWHTTSSPGLLEGWGLVSLICRR